MASITKKSDGKYLIRVSKGTGSRRSFINKTFYGKLADARDYARDQETIAAGGSTLSPGITFDKYLEKWLAAIGARVSPRTLDGYKGYIERYATAPLGRLKLSEIRPYHISEIISGLKLSPTTVRNLHAALRACFSYAVRAQILRENPCRHIDLPARTHKTMAVMSFDEANRFADFCREMPNGLIFAFALETGMRPEEYLALRWRDIDGTEIYIQQAVQFNRSGGGYYFKELKTARSRRRVPVSGDMQFWLARHRREQLEHRLSMKGTWFDHDLVFPNEIGRPYALNNLTRRYLKPILDKCEFATHFTLYSLRHSCATIMLMCDVNPKTVADRLGHSSVNLTLDVYSHVLPHIQDNATEKIANIMRKRK